MSGHLCLKWNNHSTAFLKSIVSIQLKEKYCDATIACQGKYFPVHRVILSTCSDYFEEMFERIQCPHPYIVFKDIEPREMELLLNYMYRGEVNVVQEQLPTLIKAAEALKIKGLAVPDDLPSSKESSGRKRSLPSDENMQSKRRSDERRKRRNSSELHSESVNRNSGGLSASQSITSTKIDEDEPRIIKQEPLEPCDYEETPLRNEFENREGLPNESALPLPSANEGVSKNENVYVEEFSSAEGPPFIKSEDNLPADDAYDDQTSSWSDFASSDMQNLDVPQTSQQDDDEIDIEECPLELQIKYEVESQPHEEEEQADQKQAVEVEQTEETSEVTKAPKMEKRSRKIYHYVHCCSFCPYVTANGTNLKSHIMFKHTKERPFPCTECPKKFCLKTDLRMHMRTHTGEKPFECSNCGMKFSLKGNLKSHLLSKSGCLKFSQYKELKA